ncbi:histidine phosphatase family protein [Candidatus Woesearchaeota archaeon]|nr:histidine phosphatase family protein [Candidatus Woesearchaeota archaeon]MBT4387657.1 histidine phosphatase family protein [Candidatus Woesearchaeota archaeon]MBT4595980.1 histidine phosphatase family protein [Candidatus Woesearchaeota archaeon]MBT5741110.1 histidine phosphatase family protein [Candidatus Woesearchaeota archaeon]MBT7849840.1 histidine phosphatase family protein [Candidatus Woesearchaeota archaeon]
MITIYLLRHGKTELNKKSVIMGQIDSPLLKTSLESPKKLFKYLKDIKFDYIISSDLGRAFITAFLFAKELNLTHKLSFSKDLREINYGIYANKKKEEVKKNCPEYKADKKYIFSEGESFLKVQKRAIKFIQNLDEKSYKKNKNILLISHAGVIRTIQAYFNEDELNDVLDVKISHSYIGKIVINNSKLIDYKILNN